MNKTPPGPVPESWLRTLWYDLVQVVGLAGYTVAFSARFEGMHHVPETGPTLVLANHQSYLDPWLAGIVVKRPLAYLARKTLFRNRFFAALIRSVNAVPIDQEGVAKEGIKAVVELLRRGQAVVVFPEGSRTPDGAMHPLQPGVHLILRRTPATIVPVGIAGAYDAWPIWRKYPILAPLFLPPAAGTIAVVAGAPIDSKPFAELPRDEALRQLLAAIQKVQTRAEELRRK